MPLWIRIVDFFIRHIPDPRPVSRKKYLILAVTCGWFSGSHCFYSGHFIQGILYLLLFWTGIPFAMTVIDVLLLFLKYEPDENGIIFL